MTCFQKTGKPFGRGETQLLVWRCEALNAGARSAHGLTRSPARGAALVRGAQLRAVREGGTDLLSALIESPRRAAPAALPRTLPRRSVVPPPPTLLLLLLPPLPPLLISIWPSLPAPDESLRARPIPGPSPRRAAAAAGAPIAADTPPHCARAKAAVNARWIGRIVGAARASGVGRRSI